MKQLFVFLSALGGLVGHGVAQSTTVPTVPSGTPIPGNYTGSLRPQLHYSPPQDFMNDPNGMFVDADGVWHLYYQYNPISVVAGYQHWGHATSEDLYHWVNQPIAIYPDLAKGEAIFSGSAVVDVNNTSGFFPNQTNGVVAIYTLNTAQEETQEIAYSYDGGYSFIKYAGNPVISINSTQFRDPKVIWYEETQSWVMVVAYAQEFTIGIYTSPNLKDWTHASNFSHHGLLGLQYECPNMLQMPMEGSHEPMWIMLISINPGAPLGGSITEYFPGHFNGTHFTAVDAAARIADFGKDNYAGQFFYGIPGDQRQVSIAWASNWQYTQVVPTASEGWRSIMSLPRYNYLANITRVGYDLISIPYELEPQFESELASNSSLGNGTILLDYSGVESNALYFEVNITGVPQSNLAGSVNITFLSSVSGESVRAGTLFGGDTHTWVSRQYTRGFDHPLFTDKFSSSSLLPASGIWTLSGVIDRSIFELFVNRGEQSATTTFFPTSPLDQFTLSTSGLYSTASVSAAVWALNSAWADQAVNGTVLGNLTSHGMTRRDMVFNYGF